MRRPLPAATVTDAPRVPSSCLNRFPTAPRLTCRWFACFFLPTAACPISQTIRNRPVPHSSPRISPQLFPPFGMWPEFNTPLPFFASEIFTTTPLSSSKYVTTFFILLLNVVVGCIRFPLPLCAPFLPPFQLLLPYPSPFQPTTCWVVKKI